MGYNYRNTWISNDLESEIKSMQLKLSGIFGKASRIEATRVIAWKSKHFLATPSDADLVKIMRGYFK